MSWRGFRYVDHPGPRRDPDFYDQSQEDTVLRAGDRIILPCEGGPSAGHFEKFPPRLEIPERGGTCVLLDVGPRAHWKYVFVPG
jgi:hypothetical protein